MNKRLLIITRHRLSENNGGANDSKGFVACFAALFDSCSIIYPYFDNPQSVIPAKYKLYPYYDHRSNIHKGLDVYRGRICANLSFVKQHLKNHHYDVIVIDHSFAGASLTKTIKQTGAKLITIHHNVERDYQNDNRKDYSPLFRYPYIYFANKAERDCLQSSDVNLTVTESDAATFRSWYRDIHVYNWGNFAYRPFADKTFTEKLESQVFIITGSLFFTQSLQPILEFVNDYWPLVIKTCPAAKLLIAGRNPAKALQEACSRSKAITIVPNPEDMGALVQQANYYVCPINVGSGCKLRVMDALREGLPVLCHQVSVAGYECMADSHCLFPYHDEHSFSHALHEMMDATIPPDTVYKIFKANYSTEAGVEKLRKILATEGIV